ncbi:MAG TPA: hypothetical protein VG937_25545 [Polyangiaceae bacterium]|jgi:hypothetical protein|nr:hypothetical protein [Polyangiaceae bacterium]
MSQTALATFGRSDDLWRAADWQRLWLATQERAWRSLALVPAGAGAPLDTTVHIAMALARTGMQHIGTQIHVADATELGLEDTAELTAQVRESARSGLVIVALAPVSMNPVTVPLAQSSDCAVLCVLLNLMRMAEAKHTTDQIGRSHFVGAVTLG